MVSATLLFKASALWNFFVQYEYERLIRAKSDNAHVTVIWRYFPFVYYLIEEIFQLFSLRLVHAFLNVF